MTTVIASGASKTTALAVTKIGAAVAAQAHTTATVTDVAPLPASDPAGTLEFYVVLFLGIGASLGATLFGRILGTVDTARGFVERGLVLLIFTGLLSAGAAWWENIVPRRHHPPALAGTRLALAVHTRRWRSRHRRRITARLPRQHRPDHHPRRVRELLLRRPRRHGHAGRLLPRHRRCSSRRAPPSTRCARWSTSTALPPAGPSHAWRFGLSQGASSRSSRWPCAPPRRHEDAASHTPVHTSCHAAALTSDDSTPPLPS